MTTARTGRPKARKAAYPCGNFSCDRRAVAVARSSRDAGWFLGGACAEHLPRMAASVTAGELRWLHRPPAPWLLALAPK